MKHITNHFPKAQSLSSLKNTLLEELSKNDMTPEKCIWGTSICSDEVNNSLDILSSHFAGPGPFQFGGISGIPFTGKTGFSAFSSHIPDGGGAVIIYGPHIGISKNADLGEIQREKQANNSSCCGSLVAGLNNVKSGKAVLIAHDDYQQGQVNKVLIENYDEIKQSELQIKKTTEIAYQQIKRELTDIISTSIQSLENASLLTIGGILINTDWDQEDYFEIHETTVFNK